MKIKSFVALENKPVKQTIKLPQCWILNFRFIANKIQINAVVENDKLELKNRDFFVVELAHMHQFTREYDINIDDLMYMGDCDTPKSQIFIFEVLPKDD